MLTINGKEYELNGETVAEALAEIGYGEQRVAVELNESIVPRDQYASTVLYEGDHLEVVRFVGGG
ncbi:sulfur carrier protein ThiS [Ruminococcus sp.]|uniref:sulfur carrier protein ThiS n=1 Tax=Ruminococcus sp. TaxID=41978 RepID=UPI0025EC4A9A|nr:sulfur carrier protein ThiS [Ruminococcus sp.]MCR4639882.1 sulfur carrier protein ThiS [Ruminococcus sp.]